jgi:hypothetical protein
VSEYSIRWPEFTGFLLLSVSFPCVFAVFNIHVSLTIKKETEKKLLKNCFDLLNL